MITTTHCAKSRIRGMKSSLKSIAEVIVKYQSVAHNAPGIDYVSSLETKCSLLDCHLNTENLHSLLEWTNHMKKGLSDVIEDLNHIDNMAIEILIAGERDPELYEKVNSLTLRS